MSFRDVCKKFSSLGNHIQSQLKKGKRKKQNHLLFQRTINALGINVRMGNCAFWRIMESNLNVWMVKAMTTSTPIKSMMLDICVINWAWGYYGYIFGTKGEILSIIKKWSWSNQTWCTDWVTIETSFKLKATFGFVMFMTDSSKFLLGSYITSICLKLSYETSKI